MPTRIAVTIVLLCIGVMLLSACGLPELIPPKSPAVYTDYFFLWQQDAGSPPVRIGTLRISGVANQIAAKLSLDTPSCLENVDLYLAGTVVKAAAPVLTLRSKPAQKQAVELDATLPSQQMVYSVNVAPFKGRLTVDSGCAPETSYLIQGRRELDIDGYWHGKSPDPNPFSIYESIQARRYGDKDYLRHAEIRFAHNPCFQTGETTADTRVSPTDQHFSLDFQMNTGATLTAETTVDVLAPGTPLTTHYTVHGSTCDGQTFSTTLHHD